MKAQHRNICQENNKNKQKKYIKSVAEEPKTEDDIKKITENNRKSADSTANKFM